jgi:hypothetical protein
MQELFSASNILESRRFCLRVVARHSASNILAARRFCSLMVVAQQVLGMQLGLAAADTAPCLEWVRYCDLWLLSL